MVDDSRMQRRILAAQLAQAGYRVLEAGTGEEALSICAAEEPDMVLSDWVMPGMSGLDLCRAFRAMDRKGYGYFVLLTSKTEKGEVATGLESGADDFLAKPVRGDELRARLAAGERILRMERDLQEKNRLLTDTLRELQDLYGSVERDLQEARKLQQSLVKERHRSFGSAEVSLLLRPSGHVGGDLVGFFPINARRVGLYAIDVSGHGITSALMTARLAGYLSGTSPQQNIALIQSEYGIYDARTPATLAAYMNAVVLEEMKTDSYFTLVYADVDLFTGRAVMVQAGHPHPVVQRADGRVEFLGSGGLPVGLIEGARFDSFETVLAPGDRLFMMSDGVTEAADIDGNLLGEDGLCALMHRNAGLRGETFLEALMWDLATYSVGEMNDDVSGVLFEFNGAKQNAD
ncbi:sigma-B regulation protein RsbU (phosphoserine phosphatase) [Phaeovulum vinaykumarii]|uniref:Sigma-B regulation protein RsbU (Phosphoserine phosphatase) n=1 Tax=Phaeovulum vinaykumarii TaxID=407234 RepID=A0A1N7L036_9RHOB|nr:sigma-B regulation protein RsbU (phosphoserine phosphatase) [Phaeovulum vinaykumarii]SOC00809.1 sigma-B regulation protein RsbU (phosphoserine phosphatase) [Phaeovulum vinaykumarii]